MNRMNNIIFETTSVETVCGLAAEALNIKEGSGYPRKCDGTCQLTSTLENGHDEKRKPGKRDGCIGNWKERRAKG